MYRDASKVIKTSVETGDSVITNFYIGCRPDLGERTNVAGKAVRNGSCIRELLCMSKYVSAL